MVGLFLEGQGYEILGAQMGRDAVEKAVAEKPGLVLLDINLPDIDGYEVCRQLRARVETAHVPIVMLTSRGGADDRVAGYQAGVDDYIAKPVHPVELKARVQAVLVRAARPEPAPERRARVVGVLGTKGGAGTTTIAANIAAVLQSEADVLVADLTPGSGSLGLQLGARGSGRGDLLSQPAEAVTRRMVELALVTRESGLRVLPGAAEPAGVGISLSADHVEVLLGYLGGMCDWLVLDLGDGLSAVTRKSLGWCDHVVVVTEGDEIALQLLEALLMALARDAGVDRHRVSVVVVNRAASAKETFAKVDFESRLGVALAGLVPAAAELSRESHRRGEPLVRAYPESVAARELHLVARYIEQL